MKQAEENFQLSQNTSVLHCTPLSFTSAWPVKNTLQKWSKKFFPTGKNKNMMMISNVKLFSMLVTELTSNWLKLCGWKLSNLIIDLSILSLSSKCLSLVLFFQWYAVHVLISIRSADVIMVDSCRKLCICLN